MLGTARHANQVLFRIEGITGGTESFADLEITFATSPTNFVCLHDIVCAGTEEQLHPLHSTLNGTLDTVTYQFQYNSQVEYKCGTAQEFVDSNWVVESNKTLTCQWDGTWDGNATETVQCQCK